MLQHKPPGTKRTLGSEHSAPSEPVGSLQEAMDTEKATAGRTAELRDAPCAGIAVCYWLKTVQSHRSIFRSAVRCSYQSVEKGIKSW